MAKNPRLLPHVWLHLELFNVSETPQDWECICLMVQWDWYNSTCTVKKSIYGAYKGSPMFYREQKRTRMSLKYQYNNTPTFL